MSGTPSLGFRLLPYGENAVLVELDDPVLVPAVRDALSLRAQPGTVAVVPGARTVLVEYAAPVVDVSPLREKVRAVLGARAAAMPGSGSPVNESPAVESPVGSSHVNPVRIDVHYDGVDLGRVAELAAISAEEVVARHTRPTYTVQFCGFSPGFGYLTGLDESLRLPRLSTPRPRVPAGSVGIAGDYTGVYPRVSPGGWLLLGRTDAVLFDVERDPPALLAPGTTVRFVAR